MNKTDASIRFKHAHLSTQQRRLRHLRSIAARNIKLLTDKIGNDVSVVETFCTIHKSEDATAFYHSENIKGSLNPTFRSFNLSLLSETKEIDTHTPFFIIRLWQGVDDKFYKCIEWNVSLTGLVYLGDKTQRDGLHYPPNTIIFGMLDGFYGAQDGMPGQGMTPLPVPDTLAVDVATIRTSYSPQTVSRIQTILRAIKQTQASVLRVKGNIEDKLLHSKVLQQRKSDTEKKALQVNLMRTDLEWRTMQLQSAKEQYEQLQSSNYQKDIASKNKFDTLRKDKNRLHDKKKGYFDVREELIKNGAQLVMRRKQLISELAFIYPIVEAQPNVFTICGVKLPNSEDFAGQDETMIAVSLSYTCHLVQMISQFLDVPLRYPMEHRGSRSQIKDHIIDKLSEKERDFPLYSKGKERFQFNYGVYLLNKNIAQLRYYCGLGTTDLRLTLPNLKTLLELRLGVRFDSPNSPTGALPGQHISIPPNLSGPSHSSLPNVGAHASAEASTSSRASNNSSDTAPSESNISEPHRRHNAPSTSTPVKGLSVVQIHEATSVHRPDSLATSSISGPERQELLEQGYAEDFLANNCAPTENVEGAEDALEVEDCDDKVEHKNGLGKCDVESKLNTANGDSTNYNTQQNIPQIGAAKTFDHMTREKLLGHVTNFEDIDVSSEDSVNASYGSRFKMWPKAEQFTNPTESEKSKPSDSPPENEELSVTNNSLKPDNGEEDDTLTYEQPTCDSSFKTFKTKAMLPLAHDVEASLNDDISYSNADNHRTDVSKEYQTVSKELRDNLGDDNGATFRLPGEMERDDVRPKCVSNQTPQADVS